jgi:hypothetical protein
VVRCSCPQDRAAPASPPHRQPVRKPVRSRWGATNVTRSIHGPARPPRLWQASSATEPVASVHHRDCRDHRLRSRRTSPALTCRDRLRAVGPSVTGWRRLQLGELCGICVARSGIAAETGNGSADLQALFETGATGLEPATAGVTGRCSRHGLSLTHRFLQHAASAPLRSAEIRWHALGRAETGTKSSTKFPVRCPARLRTTAKEVRYAGFPRRSGVGVEPTHRWATPVSPVLKVCYGRSS